MPFSLYRISLNSNKKMSFGRYGIGLLVVFVAIAFQSCMPEQDVVNIYSSRHYQVDDDLFDKFTEETGIKVNVVKGGADQLISRLEQEGVNSPADLLFTVDAGRLYRAKEGGVLQSSADLDFDVPEYLKDSEGYWWPVTKRARIVLYHRDKVDSANVEGYESLTDEVFHGRILMRSSQNIYNQSLMSGMLTREGEDYAIDWAKGIVNNLARRPTGNDRDQVKAVVAGDGDITIVNSYYLGLLKHSSNRGERELVDEIALHFPSKEKGGTHVNISGLGITKHAPNPGNARKLMEFMLSDGSQKKLMNSNYEYPVVDGIEPEGILQEWGSFDEDTTPLEEVAANQSKAVKLMSETGWR